MIVVFLRFLWEQVYSESSLQMETDFKTFIQNKIKTLKLCKKVCVMF